WDVGELVAARVMFARSNERLFLADVASNFVGLNEGDWFHEAARGTLVAPTLERIDRERHEGDALVFDCAEPGADGVELSLTAIRPDLHEIRPLPRLELTVVVTCGEYASDEVPIHLR